MSVSIQGDDISVSHEVYSDLAHNDFYSDDVGSQSNHSFKNLSQFAPAYQKVLRRQYGKKRVKIVLYETNSSPNSIIRHASTGAKCIPYKVGTVDEDLFFSVMVATGELGQNSTLLFYDNPEQYEAHFHIQLSEAGKESWRERRQLALTKLKKNSPRRDGRKSEVVVR